MKLEPEVIRENRNMAVGCACCSVLMAVGFLVARRFDLSAALGILVGFVLAVGNFYFMSVGITKALDTGDEAAAKTKMRTSYIARTIVMLAVMALSLAVDWLHWLPVLASVFYPRIVLTARSLWTWYRHRRHPEEEEEAAAVSRSLPDGDEDDGADEPDEFEKFVGHFSKGPVPGEEKKNGSGQDSGGDPGQDQ